MSTIEKNKKRGANSPQISFLDGEFLGNTISIKAGDCIRIGSDPKCAMILFRDPQISPLHCTVSYDFDSGEYIVVDYSENGVVYQREKKLRRNIQQRLPAGTVLTLSDIGGKIRLGKERETADFRSAKYQITNIGKEDILRGKRRMQKRIASVTGSVAAAILLVTVLALNGPTLFHSYQNTGLKGGIPDVGLEYRTISIKENEPELSEELTVTETEAETETTTEQKQTIGQGVTSFLDRIF